MILLLAFLWPFGSGIEDITCGLASADPYSMHCRIVLSDKDPVHTHSITGTLSDDMHINATFNGPLYYIALPTPASGRGPAIHLQSVKLNGQLTAKKPAVGRTLAPGPVGIPVKVP